MWHEVVDTDEVEDGDSTEVFIEGKLIAVFCVGDDFYAIDGICPHAGASVSEGGVRDGTLRCPRHGAPFDLRTGEVLGYPANEDLETYDTKVENGVVYVKMG